MKKLTSTTCLFRKLNVLKFTDLVDYNIVLLMYKVKHGSSPSGIQALFQINYVNKYFTMQFDKFYVIFARTTLKTKCVSIYGVKLWNSLDINFKNVHRTLLSKQIYKEILSVNMWSKLFVKSGAFNIMSLELLNYYHLII